MRVLFANRKDCMSRRGGDTTQMLLTKEFLERNFDVEIDVGLSPEDIQAKKYDIVHVFNITTHEQSAEIIKSALMNNSKIVLTPIYWNYLDANTYNALSMLFITPPSRKMVWMQNPVLFLINQIKQNSYHSKSFNRNVEFILSSSNLVLPNSTEELQWLNTHYNIPFKSKIIPNAIEFKENVFQGQESGTRNIILQVGLIVPNKNQLSTLLALKNFPDYPLYFIGGIADQRYYNYLLKIAKQRGNVYFPGELKSHEVIEFYKKSRIHLLPSLGETTGLVTLEAFNYGCEVIVSNENYLPVNYYRYNEIAHICDPYDVRSITNAVESAFSNPKRPDINIEEYFRFFNYETVAEFTFAAYQSVLAEE